MGGFGGRVLPFEPLGRWAVAAWYHFGVDCFPGYSSETAAPAGGRDLARRIWRQLRRVLLLALLSGLLLAAGGGDYRPSAVDLAAAPYRYSIVAWELNHLPDNALRRLAALWPGREELPRAERLAQAQEFFDLGLERRRWARRQRQNTAAYRPPTVQELTALSRRERRRQELRPAAEATVEAELSRILAAQGITAPWGGVFPPVDAVFGGPPSVLVVSPRNRIARQESVLLRPGISPAVKAEIEQELLRAANLSALVEDTGGLSVYPSIVLDTVGLRYALEITAHEWLHQWLFFRPLGRNFQASPEMLTLNETVASVAGAELGDLAWAAMTGRPRPPNPVTAAAASSDPPPLPARAAGGFDFTAEMRQTRIRTEELLAAGQIDAAEAYMERRRQYFVANNYYIRKLNQAYFAFYGSYATGPGSVSPIGGQVWELRRRSPTLKDFLERAAQFGSYREFVEYVEGK